VSEPHVPVDVLVANHRRFLAFLQARVRDPAVAEEILQAAFVKSVEKASTIRDEETAVAWFYRLLRNALTDHWRRQDARGRALDRYAAETDPAAPDEELMAAVCACLHDLVPALKPEYARAIELVDLQGKPVVEAARELGITANNAGVRLHRARQALKRELERACGTCTEHGCLECTCQLTDSP
jgi:RNA polymerase sigma factor (sigma-70 family)